MKYIKLGLLFAAILLLMLSCGEVTSAPEELGDVPTNLEITKISTNNVKLTWIYANVNSDTLTFYIARRVGSNAWDEYYDQVDSNTFEYIDYINTSDNYVYAYKVRYYNQSDGTYSNFSEAVAYFSDYTIPTELTVTQDSQTEITLTWKDNCIGEEGYRIDKKTGSGSWDSKYLELPEDTETITDYVTLFDTLYYRIYAFSGISESPTAEDSIFQTLPAPSNLNTVILDDNKIRLNWTDNSTQEEGYYIDRKVGALSWEFNHETVDSNVTTYIDNISYPCGTFTYRVRAYYDQFTSNYCPEDTINMNLKIVGELATTGDALEVTMNNWNAYVADNYEGLAVLDCSNPSQPTQLSSINLADRTFSSHILGNLAYVVTHSGVNTPGMTWKIDISDLANPVVIDSTEVDGIPKDIYVDGDYAYIAEGENGLSVVYIAGSNINYISNYPMSDARDIYVENGRAYVANGLNGLQIIDILDPNNPALISTVTTSGITNDVDVVGNYAFIADGESGLKIIDIGNAYSPSIVKTISTGGFVYGVSAEEDYVYFVDKENGFYVVDYSIIALSYILGNIELETEPISAYLNGSYVYITDNEGLKIIQIKP
jgi:hypothetical protein